MINLVLTYFQPAIRETMLYMSGLHLMGVAHGYLQLSRNTVM